jgi:hypothetical protein
MYWWVSPHLETEEEDMSGWLRIENHAFFPDEIAGPWEAADGRGGWLHRPELKATSEAHDVNTWVVAL